MPIYFNSRANCDLKGVLFGSYIIIFSDFLYILLSLLYFNQAFFLYFTFSFCRSKYINCIQPLIEITIEITEAYAIAIDGFFILLILWNLRYRIRKVLVYLSV